MATSPTYTTRPALSLTRLFMTPTETHSPPPEPSTLKSDTKETGPTPPQDTCGWEQDGTKQAQHPS